MRRLPALVSHLAGALRRWALGISADEIRYTFEDVRAEIRATRAELKEEIAALRREIDRAEGRPQAPAEHDREKPVAGV